MRTCALASFAFLLALTSAASAQPAAGPAATPGQPQAISYKYAFGNELVGDPADPQQGFATWDDKKQKAFLHLSGANIKKIVFRAGGDQGYREFLKAVEDARMDKQTGSTPTAEGTTSIVSKGLVSQVLALAVEEGALTRTDNKAIATFRGNGLGIGRLLAGQAEFPYCAIFDYSCETRLVRTLGGFSFHVSLDTSPTSGTPPAAPTANANQGVLSGGSAKQLAGWGLRYDFSMRRDLRGRKFQEEFLAKLETTGGDDLLAKLDDLFRKLDAANPRNPDYVAWISRYHDRLMQAPAGDKAAFAQILDQAVTDLVVIAKKSDGDFQKHLDSFLIALGDYFGRRDKAVAAVLNRFTVSLEYADDRPQNQPSQSNGKLILGWRPDTPAALQITFNATAARYDNAPPQRAVRRFRDAQASLQVDSQLTQATSRYTATVSLGYYFQYMADDALLTIPSGNLAPGTSIALPGDASVLLKTKGTIHIAQAGITFSVKGTGIKLPLTVSYSNRTELLKASDVRGHFGVTYDLDSLFAGKAAAP